MEIFTISIISLSISIISLIISFLILFFEFLFKKKPIIICPDIIFFGPLKRETTNELIFIFYFPITYINKSARLIIINRLSFELITNKQEYKFYWYKKSDNYNAPDPKEFFKGDELMIPFQIKKYDMLTDFNGFIGQGDCKIVSNNFSIRLNVVYNINKKLESVWDIELNEKDYQKYQNSERITITNYIDKKITLRKEKK